MIQFQIPSGEFGDPEDIAETAAFLASHKAKYINGAAIDVNGGLYWTINSDDDQTQQSPQLCTHLENKILEVFLSVVKSKLVTFQLENLSQLGWSTEEDDHFALLLSLKLFEDFVPIGTASIGPGFQSSDQISLWLKILNNYSIS